MATTKLLFAAGATLAVLLALLAAVTPAGASQLNMYEGPSCTGSWEPCWDRQCCAVKFTGSFRFYYNDGWPAYLFEEKNCSSSSNKVLTEDVPCSDGFDYKSLELTDAGGFSKEQLIKLPRAVAAGKK